jgi:hypothetical protein
LTSSQKKSHTAREVTPRQCFSIITSLHVDKATIVRLKRIQTKIRTQITNENVQTCRDYSWIQTENIPGVRNEEEAMNHCRYFSSILDLYTNTIYDSNQTLLLELSFLNKKTKSRREQNNKPREQNNKPREQINHPHAQNHHFDLCVCVCVCVGVCGV